MTRTDRERLDWLERHAFGSGVIGDDDGRWVVPQGGMQPMPCGKPQGGVWYYDVGPDEWRDSIRQAIDAAMDEEERDAEGN